MTNPAPEKKCKHEWVRFAGSTKLVLPFCRWCKEYAPLKNAVPDKKKKNQP